MADSIDFDVDTGAVTAALALEGVHTVAKGAQVVRASIHRVVAGAQLTVNVDTAATKNSIHASGPNGSALGPKSLEAEAGPTTSYAPYIHDGTSRIPPNPFMDNSLERESGPFFEAVAQIPSLG